MGWLSRGWNLIKGIGLWGGAAAGGAIALEEFSDKGQGGVLSRFVANIWKKVTETSSLEQARNWLIDGYFQGRAFIAKMMGGISSFLKFLGFDGLSQMIDQRFDGELDRINKLHAKYKSKRVFDKTWPPSQDNGITSTPDSSPGSTPGWLLPAGVGAAGAAAIGVYNQYINPAPTVTATPSTAGRVMAHLKKFRKVGLLAVAGTAAGAAVGAMFGSSEANAATTMNDGAWDAPGYTPVESASAGTVGAAKPSDVSFWDSSLDTAVNFAEGLYNEATNPQDWTLKGAGNLVLAAGHGLVQGVGSVGSFFVGHGADALDVLDNAMGLDIIDDRNYSDLFAKATSNAIDSGFGAIGIMPDLEGHWAQAVNGVASIAAPMGAVAKVGKGLNGLFNLVNKTSRSAGVARGAINAGLQTTIPGPATP